MAKISYCGWLLVSALLLSKRAELRLVRRLTTLDTKRRKLGMIGTLPSLDFVAHPYISLLICLTRKFA
jgi:hypothetical protein